MELSDFTSWLKSSYDFDCYQNELFTVALNESFRNFKNSTVNGIPFMEYYQGENLFLRFLPSFLSLVTTLLSSVPELGSNTTYNILGLNLNRFSAKKDRMLLQVSELKNLCGC